MRYSDRIKNVLLRPNNSLSQVAYKYYNDVTKWREIANANPELDILATRTEDIIIQVPLITTDTNDISIQEAADILFNPATPNISTIL